MIIANQDQQTQALRLGRRLKHTVEPWVLALLPKDASNALRRAFTAHAATELLLFAMAEESPDAAGYQECFLGVGQALGRILAQQPSTVALQMFEALKHGMEHGQTSAEKAFGVQGQA